MSRRSSPRHVVHPVSVDPVRLAVGRGGSLAVQRVGGVQECPVDLGCGGDVQAVALAAAHLSAFLQRLPFGLAETLALVEMAGDLAGHLDPDWRLGFAGAGGYRLLGSAGQQVGHSGADRDPAHLMLAGQRRNAGPGAERVPDLVDGAESGYLGAATGSDALRPHGREPVAGEFVLQVALELADRDQHVDQHCGGGGQVHDARQWPGQNAQLHAVRAAPLACSQNVRDRKSTRLNSSHVKISYAVFCLKKKKIILAMQCKTTTKKMNMTVHMKSKRV